MINKNKNFVHLHLHTHYSLLDGLGKPSEYAQKAKEMGFKYLAVTDHGNIDATIEFQNECLKREIIPIIGSELYITASGDFKGKSAHVCVYVKDQVGWRNLLEMLSIANLEHFYKNPRIDFDILYKKCEGLVITSACSGGILKLEGGEKFFKKLHKKVGDDNIFLEIHPHDLDVQHVMNDTCLRLHKETGIKLITATDAHYVNKEDKKIHDVLLAIQRKTTWNNPNRWSFTGDGYYLQSWEDILENYEKIGKIDQKTVKKSLFNTNRIAELCKDFRIQPQEVALPDCNIYPHLEPKQTLKKIYTEKAKSRLGIDLNDPKWAEYKDRVEMEYKVICDKNFEMYFLISSDFIDWCKKQDFVPGPGRGCLTKETLVFTDNGYKYLPDINVGDYVVSHSGNYNKVLNKMTYPIQNEDLLNISSFFGFNGDTMTKDHKVLSIKRKKTKDYNLYLSKKTLPLKTFKGKRFNNLDNKDLKWNNASELSVGDFMFTPWIKNRKIKDIEIFDLSNYFKEYDDEYCYYNVENLDIDNSLTNRGMSRKTGLSRNAIKNFKLNPSKCKITTTEKIESILMKNGISTEQWRLLSGQKKIKIKRFIKNDEKFLNLIGRWIGDGWLIISKNKQGGSETLKWGLCFNSDETEDMNFYKKYLNNIGIPFSETKQKNKKLIQWHIYSSEWSNFFRDLFPKYKCTSSTKYIPSIFKPLPDNKIKHLLLGLEGSDGYITKDGTESIDTTSICLRDDIKELLLYLKIPSSIKERKPFCSGKYLCNTSWKIRFSGLATKQKDYEKSTTINSEGYYSRIYKITEIKNINYVYDIEIENDNSYLTQNYIVHNSAAGSLLSYILGITEIDPIKHDLIFERFLNPERMSMPDIDFDIPDIKRSDVRRYFINKYGENNIAGISTFLYLKGKSVIRDVSRVFEIPIKEVDPFAKILEDKGIDIVKRGSLETEEGRLFTKKYPDAVDIATKLEGTVRASGQHPSALLISAKDLTISGQCHLKAIGKGDDKQIVCNWNMNDSEFSGLMKLDILALSQLSIIGEAFSLIKQTENKSLNIRDFLDVSDQNVFKELSKGNTAGVFQMNTRTMTSYIKKLGIENFNDMSACVALIRPGNADSGISDEYLLRKNGKTWEYKHPIYEEITKDTYSLCIYQESIMFMFTKMAGLPFSTADSIRKIIGKKRDVREFDQYKEMFIEGCLKNKTMTKDESLQFWTELEASANYSFNKSHSVSYAFLSYVTSWLKYYYPSHFYCANLTCGSADKKSQIVKEAYSQGLDIRLPKVGYSDADKWSVNDGVLMAPFSEIKGLGHSQAQECAQQKKQAFKPTGFYVSKEKDETQSKIRNLLTIMDAWDYNGKPNEHMQEYFDFPISNDLSVIAPTLLNLCKKHYTEEETYKIYKGAKYPSKLKLIKKYKKPEEIDFQCKGCSIQMRPFTTYFGDKTMMIITELPSWWDNENGKLLSCKTSNNLLMELYELGISYEDITVATATKCYPGKGIKPTEENKKACWGHLENEIQLAKPKIILSMGKTCEFFDPDTKISEMAGRFHWNEKYKCFIFYAWSFGLASISEENQEKFNKSIKKFIQTIKKVVNN